MAGYIFNLDTQDSLRLYAQNGVYSTKLSEPKGYWGTHHEATFADYVTMTAGDNIYFFIDRNIYGIGELVNINGDCKFCNFPDASTPRVFSYDNTKPSLLWDEGSFSINQRWLCIFKPAPYFFQTGVDMDDVLSSNPPAFRMLRAFWKVSFIKFDDEENQAFRDVILKQNQNILVAGGGNGSIFQTTYQNTHQHIQAKLLSANYCIDIVPILAGCSTGTHLRHEMAVEAGMLHQLAYGDMQTIDVFGAWDYLSHQVVSSPFKPIDYVDKMDVFGYRYITGFSPTKSKYLVAELKKDQGLPEDVDQLLKYADWTKDEYCYGDYSMIKAFLIAHDFSEEAVAYKRDKARRQYTIGRRPARSQEWQDLKLVQYTFNTAANRIDFNVVI